MAESLNHFELVGLILGYVNRKYGDRVVVFHDLPGRIGCEKPPKIGPFRPDVYAVDAPRTVTVIGEAKVRQDLETTHTREQLCTFLSHLRFEPSAELILAVPWQVRARAAMLIQRVAVDMAATEVKIVVIDEMQTTV